MIFIFNNDFTKPSTALGVTSYLFNNSQCQVERSRDRFENNLLCQS